jgi:hypothetical protein
MASAQLVRARTPVTKIERDNILATAAKVLAQMKSKDNETEAARVAAAAAGAADGDGAADGAGAGAADGATDGATDDDDYSGAADADDDDPVPEGDDDGAAAKLQKELSSLEIPVVKTAVFTLGRYQPMGENHLYVIDTVIKLAEAQPQSNAYVFITNTGGQDDNNLLIASEKLDVAESVVGGRNIQIKIKNMVNAVPFLMKEGYKNIILVVGCDRYKSFQKMLTTMVPPDIKLFIVVLPRVGQITPDCENPTPFILYNDMKTVLPSLSNAESGSSVMGMSGTKIRAEAREIKDHIDRIHAESMPLDQAKAVTGLLTLQLYGLSKIPEKTLMTLLKAMNPKRRERLLKIYNEHK